MKFTERVAFDTEDHFEDVSHGPGPLDSVVIGAVAIIAIWALRLWRWWKGSTQPRTVKCDADATKMLAIGVAATSGLIWLSSHQTPMIWKVLIGVPLMPFCFFVMIGLYHLTKTTNRDV